MTLGRLGVNSLFNDNGDEVTVGDIAKNVSESSLKAVAITNNTTIDDVAYLEIGQEVIGVTYLYSNQDESTIKLSQPSTGQIVSFDEQVVTFNDGGSDFDVRIVGREFYAELIEDALSIDAKVGDKINVAGYHSTDDDSGHTRIVQQASTNTGVLLDNGLYANITHSGFVNFNWSGAQTVDADGSSNLQNLIEDFSGKAEIVVSDLYRLQNKVRLKAGLLIRGPHPINGLNVGGLGPTATLQEHQNGFILESIGGWAFDTSIEELIAGSWVRQDDFIGKAGEIYDGTIYRAVNNVHFKDLTFISSDVLDPLEDPALETFGAINLNGSNGSTVKGCYSIGTVLGVCVAGSWGHEVSGNLFRSKLCDYLSYWTSWTKAANNYCTTFNASLDWNTRFSQYSGLLPTEMTQVRGFSAGQSPFGQVITNMISINSSTTFEDNFTERGYIGYGFEDQDTHWVPRIRGARGEFHTILTSARTKSAITFQYDFVANVTHLMELFQADNAVNEIEISVNRPDTYTNVFNYLQGPSKPFLVLKGVDKQLLQPSHEGSVLRSEYLDVLDQNVDRVDATDYWSSGTTKCGVLPKDAVNQQVFRNFGDKGFIPIKMNIANVGEVVGIEAFAGNTMDANGVTGTFRVWFNPADNNIIFEGWNSNGDRVSNFINLS